jgi:esterase/lipase superfamily enzyme
MLFVTNRRILGSRRSEAGREVAFDPADDEPGASVYFCQRTGPGSYTELLSAPFFARLRRSPRRQVLLYLHGYNCQPEAPVFPDALRLQRLCDELAPGLVEVVPLVWPCDDDFGLVLDYFDDQLAADASGLAFARVLGKFTAWRDRLAREEACLKHVNVLAHSMGNRVLRGALASWAHDYGAAPSLFRCVFMAAADLANDCLEPGAEGGMLPGCARHVVVYHAADDMALRSSKVVNLRHKLVRRRLGHTGPADLARCPENVVAADCDGFNGAADRWGHSYFLDGPDGRPGPLLRHMVETMRTGRVAGAAPGARRIVLGGAGEEVPSAA